MANEPQALVEYRDDNGLQYEPCDTMDRAIVFITSLVSNGKHVDALYQRVPFTVTVDVELGGAPRRKRKDSPAPEQPTQTTPAAADGAPKAGDVRPPATLAPATPAPTNSPARPSCGGKACETKGGVDVHRMDASCSKFTGNRKGAAAR